MTLSPISIAFLNYETGTILLILFILLFGAKKLPELARGLGKAQGEFKRARDEFETEIQRNTKDTTTPTETPRIREVQGKEAQDSNYDKNQS